MLDRQCEDSVAASGIAISQTEFRSRAGSVHIRGVRKQADRGVVVCDGFLVLAERFVDLPPLIIRVFVGLNRKRRGEFRNGPIAIALVALDESHRGVGGSETRVQPECLHEVRDRGIGLMEAMARDAAPQVSRREIRPEGDGVVEVFNGAQIVAGCGKPDTFADCGLRSHRRRFYVAKDSEKQNCNQNAGSRAAEDPSPPEQDLSWLLDRSKRFDRIPNTCPNRRRRRPPFMLRYRRKRLYRVPDSLENRHKAPRL